MYFPESTVSEIKTKASLLDVIQKFINLKKTGAEFRGQCPFCNGNNFSVNPVKEIYKCWECEQGGNNSITFLMEAQKMDYPQALQWLADFYNIYIPQENGKQQHTNQTNGKPGKAKTVSNDNNNIQINQTEAGGSTINEAGKIHTKEQGHTNGNFFQHTIRQIGLTRKQNKVKVKWLNRASQSEELPIVAEDKEGNIEFIVYDINGFIITYEKNNVVIPYKVVRLKDPKIDKNGHTIKYLIPKGIGTRPFFPPNLLQKFQAKEKIETLVLTEGYKKAISGWINGLDIVGLVSISTYRDKQTMQLHRDITELIINCQVENIILLYDGDCRDISQNALDEGKDISSRPNAFFSSARNIKELLKDNLKERDISLYFAHINSDAVKAKPKGLDDLYEALINETYKTLISHETDNPVILARKFLQAKNECDTILNKDLFSFSRPGIYFTKIPITFGLQKLLSYLALDTVNVFYLFHQERIKDKKFNYNGTQYRYNKDKNECEIIIPGEAKNYVRVGDDYFEKVPVPNKYKERELQLHQRSKVTITDDYGKAFLNHIHKFKAFCNVPEHVSYQEAYHNCFNMYNKFEHEIEQGDCTVTLDFLKHIFEEHYELGLDYIQLLYQRPTQILPILCLVSKENNTGKTTFAKWLKEIFRQNMSIVGNADLSNDFNGFWATKLIICCEEVFIDKKLLVERIKNLSTADRIIINQKGMNQHEIEFFGKFILLTNNEDSFINVSDEDIRYWIRKLKRPGTDNINMLKQMINEIPAFLYFLNQRTMHTECQSRMWFHPGLLITEALKKIQAASRPFVEKELRSRLQDMFIDFEENIIYMTVTDIRKEFFNNRYEERYILDILRNNIKVEQYWEPVPLTIDEPFEKRTKTKRYSYPKFHTNYTEGGTKQEILRVDVKSVGRPFVFLRPDFVPPEKEATLERNFEMLFLSNKVPFWYIKKGMIPFNLAMEQAQKDAEQTEMDF